MLCDGVVTVKRRWQERSSEKARDDGSSDDAVSILTGHWSVRIYEANSKSGRDQKRTPLTFIDAIVLGQLKRAIRAKDRAISISRTGDSKNEIINVRWPGLKEASFRYEALVVPQRGWVVSAYRRYHGEHLLDEYDVEYKQSSDGHWLPASGRRRYWSLPQDGEEKSKAPAIETRFEVTEIKVNDPDFDESVFDVVFDPGTYVNDIRLRTSYTVGDEKNFEALIQKTVQRARKQHPRSAAIEAPAEWSMRDILIVVMPACIVLVAHLFFVRSRVNRQDGEVGNQSIKDRQSK